MSMEAQKGGTPVVPPKPKVALSSIPYRGSAARLNGASNRSSVKDFSALSDELQGLIDDGRRNRSLNERDVEQGDVLLV